MKTKNQERNAPKWVSFANWKRFIWTEWGGVGGNEEDVCFGWVMILAVKSSVLTRWASFSFLKGCVCFGWVSVFFRKPSSVLCGLVIRFWKC
jgi:hypothetical protein